MAREGEARGHRKDCHERALGLLAVRQRSRKELERRLTQAGFDPEEVVDELARLERVGLVDDDAFARAVAEQAFGARKEGRRAVARRLATAGVEPETAAGALDEAQDDEEARAESLARERLARLRNVPPEKAFARLVGLLSRRGYPPGVARSAARRVLALEGVED
jgi:regulatory protein